MSGGTFDYDQRLIRPLVDKMADELSAFKKTECWSGLSRKQQDRLLADAASAASHLLIGAECAERLDYLLAGDDGFDDYTLRLADARTVAAAKTAAFKKRMEQDDA